MVQNVNIVLKKAVWATSFSWRSHQWQYWVKREDLEQMVLNLFCAVAHFEELQILVAHFMGQHIFVVHFDCVWGVMMTKLVGISSERMAAEVISKKKVIASPVPRMISPYGGSYAPLLLNLIRLANPLLKYANVCGPPELGAVGHRLRTSDLEWVGVLCS